MIARPQLFVYQGLVFNIYQCEVEMSIAYTQTGLFSELGKILYPALIHLYKDYW